MLPPKPEPPDLGRMMMMKAREGEKKKGNRNGEEESTIRAMLDTGATLSGHPVKMGLKNLTRANIMVQGINGIAKYNLKGTLTVEVKDVDGKGHLISKADVLMMPGVGETVLSYHTYFRSNGWRLDDTEDSPKLRKVGTGEVIILERDNKGLIYIKVKLTTMGMMRIAIEEDESEEKMNKEMDMNEFHEKCGHIKNIKQLKEKASLMRIRLKGKLNCEVCHQVDFQKQRIRSVGISRSFMIYNRVFLDICGPWKIKGIKVYLGVLVDDATRLSVAIFSLSKSAKEMVEVIRQKVIEMQKFGRTEIVRVDQGKEWWNRDMGNMLNRQGIRLEGTGPDTPENNSVAEGKIWRGVKKVLKVLIQAGCGGDYLTIRILKEAWNLAIYLINKEASRANVNDVSPMEIFKAMTGQKRKEQFSAVFGEMVVVMNSDRRKGNLDTKGEWGVVIGIQEEIVGKRGDDGAAVIMKIEKGTITRTQHYNQLDKIKYWWKQKEIRLDMDREIGKLTFKLTKGMENEKEDIGITTRQPLIIIEGGEQLHGDEEIILERGKFYMERGEDKKEIIEQREFQRVEEEQDDNQEEEGEEREEEEHVHMEGEEREREEQKGEEEMKVEKEAGDKKSINNRQPSERNIIENERWVLEQNGYKTGLRSGKKYLNEELQIGKILAMKGLVQEQEIIDMGNERMEIIMKLKVKEKGTPNSYQDILNLEEGEIKEKWKKSVNDEIDGLFQNKTLKFIRKEDMKEGIKIINSGLIFDIKDNGNFKTRFVAKETVRNTKDKYTYQDTFAPVASMPAIKMMFSLLAGGEGLEIEHYDISQAFTSTSIRTGEIIYITKAKVKNKNYGEEEGVFQLGNYLYGLRSAAKEFNELFDRKFKEENGIRNKIEPCLYEMKGKGIDLALIYVDDALKLGTPKNNRKMDKMLDKRFLYTKETKGGKFLNIGWKHDPVAGVVELDQIEYIKGMAIEFNITRTRRVPLPFKRRDQLVGEEKDRVDQKVYMQMVGVLMYIRLTTRPDIMLTVAYLGSNMKEPLKHDFDVAIGLMEYVMGTIYKKLTYTRQVDPKLRNKLIGFGDGGGVAALEDGKARIAYTIMMNGGEIKSRSSKTDRVENNMMNIEFVASYYASLEMRALADMMKNFSDQGEPLVLYSDNMSVIFVAHKPFQTRKARLPPIIPPYPSRSS